MCRVDGRIVVAVGEDFEGEEPVCYLKALEVMERGKGVHSRETC